MKTRIGNPDMFDRMMKVSGARMWIILFVLTATIVTGLSVFLSHQITVTAESDFCYIWDEPMTYGEALTKTVNKVVPEIAYLYEDIEQSYNGYPLDGGVQLIVLSFDESKQLTASDGMGLRVQGRDGEIMFVANPESFQRIIEMGYDDDDLLKVGLVPSRDYSFIYGVLYLQEGEEPLPKGIGTAEILLDKLDPVTLILK